MRLMSVRVASKPSLAHLNATGGRARSGLICLAMAGLLCSAFCASAGAQARYHVDPGKSQVQFTLGGSHEVKGGFQVGAGEIVFDRSSGDMSGSVVVEAGSGSTHKRSRDRKMLKDELRVLVFPTITFAPKHFSGTLNDSGDSSIQVQGIFTLMGRPHAITVPVAIHIEGDHCVAKGSLTIPYVSWGIKEPRFFMMKEAREVQVDLSFDGALSK